eukprot:jgi/Botrbrau1/2260/Bobra.101_2s0084.1
MPDDAAAVEGGEVDFKKLSIPDALNVLKCSAQGLSALEASARLAKYGPNKLPESKRNAFLQYLGYMWNPLSWAMEAAAIIAIALLDYADFALIMALLILNATISFVEESSADKAIKALTAALAPKAKVLRDGNVSTIEACNLVPGDIVIIRLGDVIPADVKILGEDGEHDQPLQTDCSAMHMAMDPPAALLGVLLVSALCLCAQARRLSLSNSVTPKWREGAGDERKAGRQAGKQGGCTEQYKGEQVDQAALTGESLPVKKFSGDVAFSGSAIKQGERHALVYATGSNTFFGRAAALIGATNNVSNIQKIMTRIGAVCLITIGVWMVIELAVQFGYYRHSCHSGSGEQALLPSPLLALVLAYAWALLIVG